MTADAYEVLRRALVDSLDVTHVRADDASDAVREVASVLVAEFQRKAATGAHLALADADATVRRLVRSVVDHGPLSDLLARIDVEEIFIEGARVTYLDACGRLGGLTEPTSEAENRHVVEQLLAGSDRQLSVRYPLVQARVLGGSARLTAAIPPVAEQLSATLRRYTVRRVGLAELVRRDALSRAAGAFAWALMQGRSRVVVSGEPGAGKTTLLAAMLAAAPAHHCVRVCEEIRELSVPLVHGSYYEVRPPGVDGTGEVSLRDLIRFVLAMRPDRIVVGEVRGAEAFELSRAVNAGSGFACTVHANSAPDAMHALVNAALLAGENVTERIVRTVFEHSIDVVFHLERSSGAGGVVERRVREVVGVVSSMGDSVTTEPIFVRSGNDGPLEWTGALPDALVERIERSLPPGSTVRSLLEAASKAAA